LVFVGEGPLRQRLEMACQDTGIAGRVHFLGWRPNVAEILAASSLLVLPSAWEGMPNVVLEAMASRRPVVAAQAEGVGELLGPAAATPTVPFGDSQTLSDTIVSVMRDSTLAERLAAANRCRAEQEFGIDRMVSAYENLWESLATS
jgi:glycosyltransferase involved in cell wall biosynthesis